ncbi:MAG TPA: hypothetical protein VF475_07165 [Sphingobium sp.]
MKYLLVPFIALGLGSAAYAATPATPASHAATLHKEAKVAKASSTKMHHAAAHVKAVEAEKTTKS